MSVIVGNNTVFNTHISCIRIYSIRDIVTNGRVCNCSSGGISSTYSHCGINCTIVLYVAVINVHIACEVEYFYCLFCVVVYGAVVNIWLCIVKPQGSVKKYVGSARIFNSAVLQNGAGAGGEIVRRAAAVKENKAPVARGGCGIIAGKGYGQCKSTNCPQVAKHLYRHCRVKLHCYACVNGECNAIVHNNVISCNNIGASCQRPGGVGGDNTANGGLGCYAHTRSKRKKEEKKKWW